MSTTALLLALLHLPIAADIETTASKPLPPAQVEEMGLSGPTLDPIALTPGPPSGGAVTFEVDWLLTSDPIDNFGRSFDFIQQMLLGDEGRIFVDGFLAARARSKRPFRAPRIIFPLEGGPRQAWTAVPSLPNC